MPTSRPGQEEPPAPGSRANWPLVNNPESPADSPPHDPAVGPYEGARRAAADPPADDPAAERRVTPPWLADDLPPEPPVLRLVEPAPLADRALRTGAESQLDTPPLRLVDREDTERGDRPAERLDVTLPDRRPEPPVDRRPEPPPSEPPAGTAGRAPAATDLRRRVTATC